MAAWEWDNGTKVEQARVMANGKRAIADGALVQAREEG